MGKTSVPLEELKTVTKSDTLCLILTACGTVETDEDAMVHSKDLDKYLCAKPVDDSPALLLLENCAKRWTFHTFGRQESSHLQPKTESHMSGRCNQTSVISSKKQEETSCQAQLKNHLRLNQREGTSRKRQNQKFFFLYKEANAKPTSKHDKFNRFPRDPKCEIHNMTKTMCARCQKMTEMRTSGIAPPTPNWRSRSGPKF